MAKHFDGLRQRLRQAPGAMLDALQQVIGHALCRLRPDAGQAAQNVHPSHFDEGVRDPSLLLDPDRDAWTLPLIPRALERGLPFFAICRGAQETNVALGGSLHQAVHEIEGHMDHRDPDDEPLDVQYAAAHPIEVVPGGLLAWVLGSERVQVNSLHGQAVNRLADGLVVEARAPDGVIEAFSKPGAPGFNLAVQWHPEWQAASNPVSMRLLRAFGEACAAYRANKSTSNRRPHGRERAIHLQRAGKLAQPAPRDRESRCR